MEPENPNPMQIQSVVTAPPTEAGPLAAPVSSWPTTLGIIAIIFGAGAMLTTAATLASTKWSHLQNAQMDANSAAMLQAVQAKWRPFTVGTSAVYLVLGVLLLYAGILLLKRRSSSARIIRWWSALKLGSVLANSVVGYFVTRETMAAIATNTPGLPPMGQMQETFVFFGVLLGLAWGCALPIFMLIWFSRNRIKQEMAHWS